jgi:hypothetical protein
MSDASSNRQTAAAVIAALTIDPDLHLDDDQLAEYVDGRAAGAAAIERHLAGCSDCARTVADLRELRRAIGGRRMPAVPLAAAAAVLIATGGTWWLWSRAHPPAAPPAVTAAAPGAGLEGFTPAERAVIADALATGQLPAVRNLDRVRLDPGRLMGGPAAETSPFGPASPVATAVDDDRPLLRWTPLAAARGYVATVVDDRLDVIAESPLLLTTEWRVTKGIPRGGVYTWQVRAVLGSGRSQTAPAPPQPEARFFVLDEKEAGEVASLRSRAAGSPLAGILLAQYGLMDDAEAALLKGAGEDPSATALRRLASAAMNARRLHAPHLQ